MGVSNKQRLLTFVIETLHDLNDSDEKTRMLKTASKNSNRVKSYEVLKLCKLAYKSRPHYCLR